MSDMLLTAYNGAILGPIAKVLGWVMNGIYALMSMIGIENVGLSIIIFTIVIYAILFPLSRNFQSYHRRCSLNFRRSRKNITEKKIRHP